MPSGAVPGAPRRIAGGAVALGRHTTLGTVRAGASAPPVIECLGRTRSGVPARLLLARQRRQRLQLVGGIGGLPLLSKFALALRCAAIRFRGIRSACTESGVGELNIAQTGSAIPVKWQLFYPVLPRLGFNGAPVTNLNFPPLGYLSGFAVPGCAAGNGDDTTPNTIPIDTSTNRGPFFMAEEELCEDARACY